jgi:uncharacterized membrane protein
MNIDYKPLILSVAGWTMHITDFNAIVTFFTSLAGLVYLLFKIHAEYRKYKKDKYEQES